MTATATVIFLVTKFVEGAWVVVVAIPRFILLFNRIQRLLPPGRPGSWVSASIPPRPDASAPLSWCPVTDVSRLTEHALSEALSLGDEVMAVTVVFDGERWACPRPRSSDQWQEWDPGVPLRVLHTDYASIVQPIVGFVDELRGSDGPPDRGAHPGGHPRTLRYRPAPQPDRSGLCAVPAPPTGRGRGPGAHARHRSRAPRAPRAPHRA